MASSTTVNRGLSWTVAGRDDDRQQLLPLLAGQVELAGEPARGRPSA
jgi:hypothetical protein